MRNGKSALVSVALPLKCEFLLAFNVNPLIVKAGAAGLSLEAQNFEETTEVLKGEHAPVGSTTDIQAYKPIVPPLPRIVIGAENQTSMAGFDMLTRKLFVVLSEDTMQIPTRSGVSTMKPYRSVLQKDRRWLK